MNRKIYFIFALINFIFMIFIIGWLLYLSYRSFNKIDSSDIYKMSIDSIVEIKSADEDIGESYGTGVIYDSAGYLVTNAHVVCYTLSGETYAFSNIEIRFAKTEMYQSATLIKYDTNVDLAILKIDNDSMKYNPINFSKVECNFGEKVFAIGNMLNYGLGISEGVISVPEVNIKYDNKSRLVIQADIDIAIVYVVIAETAEQIKAKSNYEFNRKLETENNGIKGVYKNTYVTNQTQTGFNGHNASNYRFGFTTFEDVGCEVAAAYNLMISLGRAEYLSETIYSFEKLGIEFAFAWGNAGSNPLQMYHYFDNKGLGYKKITSWSTFKNYVSDKGNYKIVMSRWNDPFTTGLHTFFIDKYNGNLEGFNFNYYSTSTENKTDITSYNNGDGFIVGYIIWIK